MTAEICGIALTIMAEAAGEPTAGRHGVASVIWDESQRTGRALHVVARNPARYSCWKGSRSLRDMQAYRDRVLGGKRSAAWTEAVTFAEQMVSGTFVPNIKATHYARSELGNLWGMKVVAVIGHHTFYLEG